MSLKLRLQRVLQIVEESERVGALSDLERDIILAELREAYSEVKFGEAECAESKADAAKSCEAVVAESVSSEPDVAEQEEDEPEMEVEIIFNDEDEESDDEVATEVTQESAPESISEPTPEQIVEEPAVEIPVAEEPVVEEKPVVEESVAEESAPAEPVTPVAPAEQPAEQPTEQPTEQSTSKSTPQPTHRSPILSLYDEGAPVVGEQFGETRSVADAITCTKGVAETAPVSSLRDAIGVADKFMLIRELFNGDADAYEAAIDKLDSSATLEDCVIYIAENYTWSAQLSSTKFMMELLQRKYNA